MFKQILNYYINAGEAKREMLLQRWVEKPVIYRWEDVISENIKRNRMEYKNKFIV